jgi:hypothetical protein
MMVRAEWKADDWSLGGVYIRHHDASTSDRPPGAASIRSPGGTSSSAAPSYGSTRLTRRCSKWVAGDRASPQSSLPERGRDRRTGPTVVFFAESLICMAAKEVLWVVHCFRDQPGHLPYDCFDNLPVCQTAPLQPAELSHVARETPDACAGFTRRSPARSRQNKRAALSDLPRPARRILR